MSIIYLRETPQVPSYKVTVNYDQTVEQLIESGHYDWTNSDITSNHFPSNENGQVEVVVYLVNFNRDISSDDARKELDCQCQRSATLKELLALGAQHPNLQRKNTIIIHGSEWVRSNGDLVVPCLDGIRRVDLVSLAGFWHSFWRFAVVRK